MNARMNQLTNILRLTGIAALVLCVGAARPANVNKKSATRVNKPVAAVAVAAPAVVVMASPAPAAADLMYDAAPAAAVIPPATIAKRPRTIRMEVTAYCPCKKCCGENAQGITASGHDISYNQSRFVAADTDRLPFGTKLMIPGYHGTPVEVIDRGGAIKGHKLDVFYPTHEEALQWGRQWVEVTVVD